jgi:hypothetical protein
MLLSNLEESDGDGSRWWWMGRIVKVSSFVMFADLN